MQEIRFYKEPDGVWYADIPNYLEDMKVLGASKADLQMVLGADKFLAELASTTDNENEITLLITPNIQEIRIHDKLPAFVPHNWEYLIRADYIPTITGKYYTGYNSKYLWLSDVTLWVFGEFPQYIYYKIVKTIKNENH